MQSNSSILNPSTVIWFHLFTFHKSYKIAGCHGENTMIYIKTILMGVFIGKNSNSNKYVL